MMSIVHYSIWFLSLEFYSYYHKLRCVEQLHVSSLVTIPIFPYSGMNVVLEFQMSVCLSIYISWLEDWLSSWNRSPEVEKTHDKTFCLFFFKTSIFIDVPVKQRKFQLKTTLISNFVTVDMVHMHVTTFVIGCCKAIFRHYIV